MVSLGEGEREEAIMYEELCKRLRGMWDGEGGPANEAAEVIERLEEEIEELQCDKPHH